MFQNVLMTSLTPLRNTDEIISWQNRPLTTIWPEPNHQEPSSTSFSSPSVYQPKNGEVTKTIKKRTKRLRTAYTTDQLRVLERTYTRIKYISADKRKQLADSLNITEKSIKVWFQNRRMKEKRESSESSDSSQEVTTTGMSPPRPMYPSQEAITTATSPPAFSSITPKLEPEVPKVGTNQYHSNHSNADTAKYELPSFHFCDQNAYQTVTPPVVPTSEPFADDRNVYPTYYYPTLEDYYFGDSYRYDNGDAYGNDVQWSATNFDLNYFQ